VASVRGVAVRRRRHRTARVRRRRRPAPAAARAGRRGRGGTGAAARLTEPPRALTRAGATPAGPRLYRRRQLSTGSRSICQGRGLLTCAVTVGTPLCEPLLERCGPGEECCSEGVG